MSAQQLWLKEIQEQMHAWALRYLQAPRQRCVLKTLLDDSEVEESEKLRIRWALAQPQVEEPHA